MLLLLNFTPVALQVKKPKNSAEFPHKDFITNTPNCFRTETSGHLLCCIIFGGGKKEFHNLVSLTLASQKNYEF